MLQTELITTCSIAAVAAAVLRSLGCDFHARVSEAAGLAGEETGAFAAGLVQRFAREANVRDWSRLQGVMAGDDMPLLAGFGFVVEEMIARQAFNRQVLTRQATGQRLNIGSELAVA